MEMESCVNFSLLFRRFSCIVFCCVFIPVVAIDGLVYQGSTDININGTSLFMMKPMKVTAIITDLDLLEMAVAPINQQSQDQIHAPNDFIDMQLFSWWNLLSLSLSQVVYFVVVVTMFFMLWQQRELVDKMQKELSCIQDENNSRRSILQQIQASLDKQQSHFTSTTYKMAAMNKRINEVSSELDEENSELETMYKCLEDWKEDWKCQSEKIRQINPDKLPKLPRMHQSEIDAMIKDQQQEIRKYINHADLQLKRVYQYLDDDHDDIMDIGKDLEYIYDVLKEVQERSQ